MRQSSSFMPAKASASIPRTSVLPVRVAIGESPKVLRDSSSATAGGGSFDVNRSSLSAARPADYDDRPGAAHGDDLSFEEELAELPPVERWNFLFLKRKRQFVLLAMSLIVWIFAAVSAWSNTNLFQLHLILGTARADTTEKVVGAGSIGVATGDVFLLFLGCFIVWSLATVTFARNADKIKLASDVAKTLLGFLVGYFTSSKAT